MTRNEKIAVALIKKAIELRRVGILCLIALSMTACSGVGVKWEAYRIDEISGSHRTYPKPVKCLFVSCPEFETTKTGGES